jgi:2-dehydropantoate 2-reductase
LTSDPKTRIAIIGIGGIGGYFGTKLLTAYSSDEHHEIIFLQRGEHLKKIQEEGVRYITKNHDYRVFPYIASDNPSKVGDLDVVFFCVKSYDLEQAALSIRKNLNKDTVILTALNGVEIIYSLKKVLKLTHILPGAIYLSAHIAEPGLVRQVGGVGAFYFGPEDGHVEQYRFLEKLLTNAGIKAKLDNHITQRLWEKYIFVCPLASLTSLYDVPIGAVIKDKKSRDLLRGLIEEIRKIAEKKGIIMAEDTAEIVLEKAKIIPYNSRTSMQVDFQKRKKTEIDIFTSFVVKKGRELGIPVPLHERIYADILDKYRQ